MNFDQHFFIICIEKYSIMINNVEPACTIPSGVSVAPRRWLHPLTIPCLATPDATMLVCTVEHLLHARQTLQIPQTTPFRTRSTLLQRLRTSCESRVGCVYYSSDREVEFQQALATHGVPTCPPQAHATAGASRVE